MFQSERRQSPRICPKGLKASIYLEPTKAPALMEGDVVDISNTGIKIRLKSLTTESIDGKIKIQLFLPSSGMPLSVTGILKHHLPPDIGVQYHLSPNSVVMDKFLFECAKLASFN